MCSSALEMSHITFSSGAKARRQEVTSLVRGKFSQGWWKGKSERQDSQQGGEREGLQTKPHNFTISPRASLALQPAELAVQGCRLGQRKGMVDSLWTHKELSLIPTCQRKKWSSLANPNTD